MIQVTDTPPCVWYDRDRKNCKLGAECKAIFPTQETRYLSNRVAVEQCSVRKKAEIVITAIEELATNPLLIESYLRQPL